MVFDTWCNWAYDVGMLCTELDAGRLALGIFLGLWRIRERRAGLWDAYVGDLGVYISDLSWLAGPGCCCAMRCDPDAPDVMLLD